MELFKHSKDPQKAAAQTDSEQPKKQQLSVGELKKSLKKIALFVGRFQTMIVILLLAFCLAFATLRMLSYANPAPSEEKIQENLGKIKQVRIDPKTIERIKQLSDSKTSTTPQLQPGRTNPFAE